MRTKSVLSSCVISSALLCASLLMTGCGAGIQDQSATDAFTQLGAPIKGTVHGGQQAIIGASLYMFAANTTGYGSASVSLINNFPGGTFPSSVDGSGNYYITTNSLGNFYLAAGEYSCTVGQQVYIYSVGGNTGAGSVNANASLMAILGTCGSGGTFSAVTSGVNLSEISTVAAAYALAGYAVDSTHVSSSGTSLALTGIQNAFNNAAQLYNINNYTSYPNSTTPNGNGTVPQAELVSLADSLAACVNSTGSGSPGCNGTFNNVKSSGATGTTATDTATEAIYIAHNPGVAVSTVFYAAGSTVPYTGGLSSAPNDWTVAITYTDSSFDNPYGIAADAAGDVWITNQADGTVTELSPIGVSITSGNDPDGMSAPAGIAIDTSGNAWVADEAAVALFEIPAGDTSGTEYQGANGNLTNVPTGVAIDPSGYIWVSQQTTTGVRFDTSNNDTATTGGHMGIGTGVAVDASGNIYFSNESLTIDSVSKYNSSGTGLTTTAAYKPSANQGGNAAAEEGIAIDASGDFWYPNYKGASSTSSITELSSTGSAVSGSGVYTGGGLKNPEAIAFDGSGYAWVSNNSGNLSEFNSSGIAVTGSQGYAGGTTGNGIAGIQAIAVDGSGNVWALNYSGNYLVELIGAAAPVVTPLVANLISPYTHAASKP